MTAYIKLDEIAKAIDQWRRNGYSDSASYVDRIQEILKKDSQ